MNVLRYAALTALVAFAAGFWTGCSVGLDAAESDTFSCVTEEDCIDGHECVNNLCRQRRPPGGQNNSTCVDVDGDGYGENADDAERADCRLCENPNTECQAAGNCCAIDCDDSDASVRPNAVDSCDGVDNNCDGTPDENNAPCSAANPSCPQPANFIGACIDPSDNGSCESGDTGCVCRVSVLNTLNAPETCKDLQCVGGEYEVPSSCP